MNKLSKAFAKPKQTKRQRKAEGFFHRLAAAKALGARRIGEYYGRNPEYTNISATVVARWVKSLKGIPFVRAEPKA